MWQFEFIVSGLIIWICYISKCNGYDKTLTLNDDDCDHPQQNLGRDETALIEWYGQPFNIRHNECTVWFSASDYGNALTKFRICFKLKERYFSNCDIKLIYIRTGFLDNEQEYGCQDTIPEEWCTGDSDDSHNAKLRIVAKESSSSKFKIEVFVKADESGITTLIIAVVVVVVVGVALTIIIICICRKCRKVEKPSEGMVVRSPDDLRNTQFEGETLVGYPTQQTEMVPAGRGRYRPKNITVQTVIPRGAQQQPQVLYTSQQPAATIQQPSTTYVFNDQTQHQSPEASAPPPSYDMCTK